MTGVQCLESTTEKQALNEGSVGPESISSSLRLLFLPGNSLEAKPGRRLGVGEVMLDVYLAC